MTEYHKSEIVYHTKNELETLFKEGSYKKLKEKELITDDVNADSIDVVVDYSRRYVGDATPIKSDFLGYPNYAYTIIVKNKDKNILEINRKNLIFKGDFAMNLQIIAGTLRDKKYEIDFIDALSNAIINEIDNLDKK